MPWKVPWVKTLRQGLYSVLCLYIGWVGAFYDYSTIWHLIPDLRLLSMNEEFHITKPASASINLLCPIQEKVWILCVKGLDHLSWPFHTVATLNFTLLALHHLQDKIQKLDCHINLPWSGFWQNCVPSFPTKSGPCSPYIIARLITCHVQTSLVSPLPLWLCLGCLFA